MRITLISGLCFCLCIALTIPACKRMTKKDEPLDAACSKDIRNATKLLEAARDQLEKNQFQQIENLITAAKTEQQHQKYSECEDLAQRALHLLPTH